MSLQISLLDVWDVAGQSLDDGVALRVPRQLLDDGRVQRAVQDAAVYR